MTCEAAILLGVLVALFVGAVAAVVFDERGNFRHLPPGRTGGGRP